MNCLRISSEITREVIWEIPEVHSPLKSRSASAHGRVMVRRRFCVSELEMETLEERDPLQTFFHDFNDLRWKKLYLI